MEHDTNEPLALRPCSTPHSAPIAWLRTCPDRVGADGPPAPAEPDADSLSAALELVLAHPEAVAEIIGRAPPAAFVSHAGTERGRSDGWTGERMARFLEVLADTGLITEGCRAVGMERSGFYALCNRDPVFAAAVSAAKTLARPQVADGLLERSITGTVEHYYRDGVLVGERRHYESWLGLAVLKRLDKQAADDEAEENLSARIAGDWRETLDALREGGTSAVPALLDAKVDKVDIPPPPGFDAAEHCWKIGSASDLKPDRERGLPEGSWMTTFPPPPGFDGYQNVPWDGLAWYERECTVEEVALLETHQAAMEAEEYAELTAEAETERDEFFAGLRSAIRAAGALVTERGDERRCASSS